MAYHHGQLRAAILTAAAETIEAGGLATLSLRDLARQAGVSHAAPAHHFGDRAGLLTALAADGFRLLSDTLADAGDNFLERGVAYVRFGTRHRGHFEVMFRPDLYHPDDPDLVAAQNRAADLLYSGAATVDADAATTGLAGWALVHGLTSLYNAGALPDRPDDAEALARRVAARLIR